MEYGTSNTTYPGGVSDCPAAIGKSQDRFQEFLRAGTQVRTECYIDIILSLSRATEELWQDQ
jgi:hypothetical protein